MTVYMVGTWHLSGEYSFYGIFSTMEKAQQEVARLLKYGDHTQIEEVDVDVGKSQTQE